MWTKIFFQSVLRPSFFQVFLSIFLSNPFCTFCMHLGGRKMIDPNISDPDQPFPRSCSFVYWVIYTLTDFFANWEYEDSIVLARINTCFLCEKNLFPNSICPEYISSIRIIFCFFFSSYRGPRFFFQHLMMFNLSPNSGITWSFYKFYQNMVTLPVRSG